MKRLRPYVLWLLLFVAALLPRLWQLDRFITADEILFLDHARDFLEGLASGDLSLTLGIGYPGVTLAWANALGLLFLHGFSRLGLVSLPVAGQSLGKSLGLGSASGLQTIAVDEGQSSGPICLLCAEATVIGMQTGETSGQPGATNIVDSSMAVSTGQSQGFF